MFKNKSKVSKASLASVLAISLFAPLAGIAYAETEEVNNENQVPVEEKIVENTVTEEVVSEEITEEVTVGQSTEEVLTTEILTEEPVVQEEFINENEISTLEEPTYEKAGNVEESIETVSEEAEQPQVKLVSTAEDSISPEILDVEIDRKTYAPGEKVKLLITVAEESDISYAYLEVHSSNSDTYRALSNSGREVIKNDDGTYTIETYVNLPENMGDATYSLEVMKVDDVFANTTILRSGETNKFNISFDVKNEEDTFIDTKTPEILDVEIDRRTYAPGEKVKLLITVAEESDISYAYLEVHSSNSTNYSALSNSDRQAYKNDDGTYTIETYVNLPENMTDSTYSLGVMKVDDVFANTTILRSGETNKFNISFEVKNQEIPIEEESVEETDSEYVNNFTIFNQETGKEIASFTILGQEYKKRLNERLISFNKDHNIELSFVSETITGKTISSSTINGNTISRTTIEFMIYVVNESDNELGEIKQSLVPDGIIYDDVTNERAYRKVNIYDGNDNLHSTSYIASETIDDSIRNAMYDLNSLYPGIYYYDGIDVSRGFTSIFTSSGFFQGTSLGMDIYVDKYEESTEETPVEDGTDEESTEETPVEDGTDEESTEETPVEDEIGEEPTKESPIEEDTEEPIQKSPIKENTDETHEDNESTDDEVSADNGKDEETTDDQEFRNEDSEEFSIAPSLLDENTGITVSSEYGELEGLQLIVEMLKSSDRISSPHDLYNIKLLDVEGNEYELQNSVTVSIPVNDGVTNVYYLGEELTSMFYDIVEGNAVFTVDGFSQYAVVYVEASTDKDDAVVTDIDTDSIANDKITPSSSTSVEDDNVTTEEIIVSETDEKESEEELLPNTGIAAKNIVVPAVLLMVFGSAVVYFTRRKLN